MAFDKKESKARELYKQSYIDKLECRHYHHNKESCDLAAHDWCQMREVMKQVFGYTDERLDFNETRWWHEWKKNTL